VVTRKGRVAGAKRAAGSGARSAGRVVSAASGSRKSTAGHVEAQNAVLLGPWLVLVAALVIGQLVHTSFLAISDWTWLAYTGLVGATGLVAYAAWHTTKSRSVLSLSHTLATVIGIGIFLIFAAYQGLFHMSYVSWWLWRVPVPEHPTFDLWWMFGGAAAIIWNIRQGVSREHIKDAANPPSNDWEDGGVPGVSGDVKQVSEYKMQGILTLPKGMTVENIQGSIAAIESAKGWPRKSTRILPAPGKPVFGARAKALAIVMLKDPLAGSVPWPGVVIKRGMNLMSLIPTGVDSDGDEGGLWVVRPEGTKHALIQGMTGSGKSEGEKPIVLYTAALGAVNIIIDTVKKTQTFGPLAPALHWLATDEGTAKAILRRIAKEVIPARTEFLAQEGLAQWSLKSKLSLVRLHIEEAWDLVDTDEITAIALAARSAGIQLNISLQRASHDMISTTVREQLGTRRCYGLGGGFGTMVLDDEVVEAGADPERWKDTAPGMHYMQRGGMTLDEKVIERRSYFDCGVISFAEAATQIASKLKPMDPVTAAAFGPLWANHTTPMEVVKRVGSVRNVTKVTGDALKNAADAVNGHPAMGPGIEEDDVPLEGSSDEETPALPGATPDVLSFLAQLSGTTPTEMAEALKIYTERNGDVESIINGTETEYDDGEEDGEGDMHVVESDDFVTTERSADGRTMTISTPGLADQVIDYGENAPDAEDLALLERIDPDAPLPVRPADRPPLRLGVPKEHAWPQDKFDAALMVRFKELKAQGKDMVKGGDFADVIAQAGWARTIIYPRLRSWERELGIVTETPDGFVIVKG
jgi:hypothetical protein